MTSKPATDAPSFVVDRYDMITLTAGPGGVTPPPGGGPGGGGNTRGPPPPPGPPRAPGQQGGVDLNSSSNQSDDGGGGGAAGPVIGVLIALAAVGGFVYWYTKVCPQCVPPAGLGPGIHAGVSRKLAGEVTARAPHTHPIYSLQRARLPISHLATSPLANASQRSNCNPSGGITVVTSTPQARS